MAFVFVSALIQAEFSICDFIEAKILSIILSMPAFISGVNFVLTYSMPRASPKVRSVASTQRFHRGCCSFVPAKTLPLKLKASSTKAFGSVLADEFKTIQRKYVFQLS